MTMKNAATTRTALFAVLALGATAANFAAEPVPAAAPAAGDALIAAYQQRKKQR
jgi:hypothetical protein